MSPKSVGRLSGYQTPPQLHLSYSALSDATKWWAGNETSDKLSSVAAGRLGSSCARTGLVSYPAPTSANMADDAEGRVWGLCT